MGRKMVMVAGLLATSVMDVTIRQAMVTMANTGRFPNGLISSATQVDKPDTCGLNNRMGKSISVCFNKDKETSKEQPLRPGVFKIVATGPLKKNPEILSVQIIL